MAFALTRFALALLAVASLSVPFVAHAEEAAEGGEVRYVVVDGKKMTWEEAKKKYPDLPEPTAAAPAETVTLDPAPAAEAPAAEAPAAEAPAAEEAPAAAPAVESAPAALADQAMNAGNDPEYDKRVAMEKARRAVTLEEDIRKNIRRLAMPGWRTAESNLIAIGKPAIPYLIDAMKPGEKPYPESTFQIRAPVRKVRQRALDEVVFEVLYNMVHNHSTYKGSIPARDHEKWSEFWSTNGGGILFGKEAILAAPIDPLPTDTDKAKAK